MAQLPWFLIACLATTGLAMGAVSCLVGMRPKVENPAWWALYAVWVAAVLMLQVGSPFLTILVASTLAGFLHGAIRLLLLEPYRRNNPWHAEQAQAPRSRLALQWMVMGTVVGIAFGAVAGGIASGLGRLLA